MTDQSWLTSDFDCVVMMTWSDWRTEPRANRYHYATRFARHLPVYFLQTTDPARANECVERVEGHDINIVHLGYGYGDEQTRKFTDILEGNGHRKPLYWIYNPCFFDICRALPSSLTVYHATEDYLGKHADMTFVDEPLIRRFEGMLCEADLVVAVSDRVAENTRANSSFQGEMLVLRNGCDAEHWLSPTLAAPRHDAQIAIFQGGVNGRLDYPLIEEIVTQAPDWTFWFCGHTANAPADWGRIASRPNVRSFGQIHPDVIAKLQARATVGIIPFQQNSFIYISLPLKAYEYVASGLPVVTVPIQELEKRHDLFEIASDAESFLTAMRRVAPTRHDPECLQTRAEASRQASYDTRFDQLLKTVQNLHGEIAAGASCEKPKTQEAVKCSNGRAEAERAQLTEHYKEQIKQLEQEVARLTRQLESQTEDALA